MDSVATVLRGCLGRFWARMLLSLLRPHIDVVSLCMVIFRRLFKHYNMGAATRTLLLNLFYLDVLLDQLRLRHGTTVLIAAAHWADFDWFMLNHSFLALFRSRPLRSYFIEAFNFDNLIAERSRIFCKILRWLGKNTVLMTMHLCGLNYL